MKIGVMQPYFIPYLGYWQLIKAVDTYVIYDDVNYINRGWINRNRILINGQPYFFNIPMIGASQNKKINEIQVNDDEKKRIQSLRTIEYAYKKAPHYKEVYVLIDRIINSGQRNLASYLEESIKIVCDYLDIKTELILSSGLKKDCNLRGQEKILSICELLGASEYYNAIGGRDLYSANDFKNRGIELKFLKMNDISYKQFNNLFQANLSILDVMMFNSKVEIKRLLHEYTLF